MTVYRDKVPALRASIISAIRDLDAPNMRGSLNRSISHIMRRDKLVYRQVRSLDSILFQYFLTILIIYFLIILIFYFVSCPPRFRQMCDACDLILLNLSCVLRYVAKDKRIFRNVLEYIYILLSNNIQQK